MGDGSAVNNDMALGPETFGGLLMLLMMILMSILIATMVLLACADGAED